MTLPFNPLAIPGAPVELQARIDAHAARFAGLTMSAAPTDGETGSQNSESVQKPNDGAKPEDGDKPLGPNGEKALKAERQRAADLETQVKELSGLKPLADAITAAFGGDKGAKPEDAVADLASQFDQMKADLEVERLARQYSITDEKDIDLLRKASADTRSDLAVRLQPAKGQGVNPNGSPKPDPSAGRGGGEGSNTGSVSSGRDLYAERHGAKKTT